MFAVSSFGDADPADIEPRAGHVGYLARSGLAYEHWLDAALAHYVDEPCASRARSVKNAALVAVGGDRDGLRDRRLAGSSFAVAWC